MQIYYQNCRGLRTKVPEFYQNVLNGNYAIIALTETWLNSSISSSELFDNRYVVTRSDRPNGRRGGGVALAISTDIEFSNSNITITGIESTWIIVKLRNSKPLLLGCIYMPPSMSVDTIKTAFTEIYDVILESSSPVLLLGDFNINSNSESYYGSLKQSLLLDLLNICNVCQLNTVNNNFNNMLDLVITDLRGTVSEISAIDSLVMPDLHHPALSITLNMKFSKLSSTISETKFWKWRSGDYVRLYSETNNKTWDAVFECKDPEQAALIFNKELHSLVSSCVPIGVHNHKRTRNYPTWFSMDLIELLRIKNSLHRKFKKSDSKLIYDAYSAIRKRCKDYIIRDYKSFTSKLESRLRECPREFWTYLKSRRHSHRSTRGEFITPEGTTINDSSKIANSFALHFSQSMSEKTVTDTQFDISQCTGDPMILRSFDEKDITHGISKLHNKHSSRIDSIPPFIFKALGELLSPALLHIFNLCLDCGKYPDDWKKTSVVPVHKSGPSNLIVNFRPIAILQTLAKIFDNILHKHLLGHVHSIMPSCQHGFLPRRDVSTNLVIFTDYVLHAIENGSQTDTIFFDLKKAFDSVSHHLLIRKLRQYGVNDVMLALLQSYLTDRPCSVCYNNEFSSPFYPKSGVPQGSVLGPLLFNIFTADLPDCIHHSQILMYADDTKLFSVIDSRSDAVNLQKDIDSLCSWCSINHLQINPSKSTTMTFTFNKDRCINYNYQALGQSLSQSNSTRDLGIIMDKKMTFNEHIVCTRSKALRVLGPILRNTLKFTNPATILHLFKSLVVPILMFGTTIWNGCTMTQSAELEQVQAIFTRYMKRKYITFDVSSRLISLEHLRREADLKLLQKIVTGQIDVTNLIGQLYFQVPRGRLRGSHRTFRPPLLKKLHTRRSPFFRIQESYNCNASVDLFK